jgi:hypothetical protein
MAARQTPAITPPCQFSFIFAADAAIDASAISPAERRFHAMPAGASDIMPPLRAIISRHDCCRRRRHAAAAPPASAAFALPFSMLSYAGDADADISPFTPMPTLFSTLHYYDAITPTLFRHFISPPPFSPSFDTPPLPLCDTPFRCR